MENYIQEFKNAMIAEGICCEDSIIPDGIRRRFHIDGDRPGTQNGWYVLNLNPIPMGNYGCWKRGINKNWYGKNPKLLNTKDKTLLRIKRQKLIREQEESYSKASEEVKDMWAQSLPANKHPYLEKKKVKTYGLRENDSKLVIPLYDINGQINSLQYIFPNGDKQFFPGAKLKGNFFIIGENTNTIYICEGYATGATVHEATNCAVVIAFNCHNLLSVAKNVKAKYPNNELTLVADNDQWGKDNSGISAANKAAQIINAKVLAPDFSKFDVSSKPTDFNDLMHLAGIEEVKKQLCLNNFHTELANIDDDNIMINRLALLSELDYQRQRKVTAKKLSISVNSLDKLVKQKRSDISDEKNNIFPNIEPWHEPVELEQLLNELAGTLNQLLVFSSEYEAKTIALWIIHTYCLSASDISPILFINSPEKRCGKTTLMTILQKLVNRSMSASSFTPAAIYRSIEKWQPTLLIDEADTFMRDNEALRGVINSGHTKDSAYVIRCEGDDHEPTVFSTWCPKVIAGIGNLPDTIEDRSIIIQLRRKLPHEKREKIRNLPPPMFNNLRKKCVRLSADNIDLLTNINPEIPNTLNDRAADNWRPLLVIAELARYCWPKHARNAALYFCDTASSSISINIELLQDIKNVFEEKKSDRISTYDLLESLCQDCEASWPTYNRGKPLTARQLANILKEFHILSKTIRISFSETKKGYYLKPQFGVFVK